jgi:hypothetical protein
MALESPIADALSFMQDSGAKNYRPDHKIELEQPGPAQEPLRPTGTVRPITKAKRTGEEIPHGKRRGPEHIGSILRRVLGNLEKQYRESAGMRAPNPFGSSALATTSDVPANSLEGRR